MSQPTRPKDIPKLGDSETWYAELEPAENGLTGRIIVYGDKAERGYWHKWNDVVEAGAITLEDVIVNLQHQRTVPVARQGTEYLDITDSETEMLMELTYPDNYGGRLAKEYVETGVLRGLSMELRITKSDWSPDYSQRTIKAGTLRGIGIVDKPAFPQSTLDAAAEDLPPEPPKAKPWRY